MFVKTPHYKRVKKSVALTYPHGRDTTEEYFKFIRHKKIILVGPNAYLRDQNKGKWIDSFDVVVRINHAFPIAFPEDYGSRCDVLYHIMSHRGYNAKTLVTQAEVDQWDIDWLVCRHHSKSERTKEVGPLLEGKDFRWCCMHHAFYSKIKQCVGSKTPNTGIAAMMHLLSVSIKSLHVVGFGPYSAGVYEGYGDVKLGENGKTINDKWHDEEAQKRYVKTINRRDHRLHLDDFYLEYLGEKGVLQ